MVRRRVGKRGFGLHQHALPSLPGLRAGCDLVGVPCWEAELETSQLCLGPGNVRLSQAKSLWADQ